MEFPSGGCLPDMNRSVPATRDQLPAVRAPAEPPDAPELVHRRRRLEGQDRLFAVDIPDSDQALGGALGEPLTGTVPRDGRGEHCGETWAVSLVARTCRQGSQVLVRE